MQTNFIFKIKTTRFVFHQFKSQGDLKIALVYVKNVFNIKIPFISPLFHEDKFKLEVMAF